MLPWEKPLAKIDVDVDRRHYNYCFGCGMENPLGLKLAFEWDGSVANATFTPGNTHQGWPETMHGGLLCAILDEAIGWAAYFQGIRGVTGKFEARLKRPVPIGQTILVRGSIVKATRKLVRAQATIQLSDGIEAAEGAATIYVMSRTTEAA